MKFLLPGCELKDRRSGPWASRAPAEHALGLEGGRAGPQTPVCCPHMHCSLSHPLTVTEQHPEFRHPGPKWGGHFPSHRDFFQALKRNGLESTYRLVPVLRVETNQSLFLLLSS